MIAIHVQIVVSTIVIYYALFLIIDELKKINRALRKGKK